jgi:hypothetical protein
MATAVFRRVLTRQPRVGTSRIWEGGAGAQAEIESSGVHLIDSLADLRPALQRLAAEHQA